MKPTNHLFWSPKIGFTAGSLMQWWADDEGYGEWREVEHEKFSYPAPPEGFKYKYEKK